MNLFLILCLVTSIPLNAGAIIRSVTNNSTNTEIIVMGVEQPKSMNGVERYVSSQGYGWAIMPKKHADDKAKTVQTNWGAGAYKYILIREKDDGESCRKYCLLVTPDEIKLKKRDNCLIIGNEKCGTKNDDFPDEAQTEKVASPSFIDLYLNADGRTFTFTTDPQPAPAKQVANIAKPRKATEHEPFEMPYGRKVAQPEL